MNSLDDLVVFAKRRGFIFPSSEIYDGFGGIYDFGPLGVELANNLKKEWWNNVVKEKMNVVGLDSGIVMSPKVWEASGHVDNFSDPFVFSKETGERFRADHLLEEIGVHAENLSLEEFRMLFNEHKETLKEKSNVKDFSEPTFFNLLVSSNIGSVAEEGSTYLRGETCQGIYVNFKQVLDSMRLTLPFGIAQIGKAFRNEISPRRFLFRTREFEQMELQYFIYENEAEETFKTFLNERLTFLESLGLNKENLRLKEHENLVFYAKSATDIEYNYTFGWAELEGIHNRGDYDLKQHSKSSGKSLTYFDQESNEHITPYVIETSIGLGRLFLAILNEAYVEEKLEDGDTRIVLRLKKHIAPIYVSILPLMKKDGLSEKAKEIAQGLSKKYSVQYDETGSIGKRYRRQDEIGTPYCVTVDYDTLEKGTVTVRDRDSMKQQVIELEKLEEVLKLN